MITVSPGEGLGPDAQVNVGMKLWPAVFLYVMMVFRLCLVAVVGSEEAYWYGSEERDVAPGVSEADGVVLFCRQVLHVGARRASPRALDTSQTHSQKRRHFRSLRETEKQ